MKTNFRKEEPDSFDISKIKHISQNIEQPNEVLTKEEFEAFIIKSGARGSFMVYRSNKKNEELGIEEL